jgi:hypothetical protein
MPWSQVPPRTNLVSLWSATRTDCAGIRAGSPFLVWFGPFVSPRSLTLPDAQHKLVL